MTREEFEFMEKAKKDEKGQGERWRDQQRVVITLVNELHKTVCEANERAQQNHVEVIGGLWLLAAFAGSWTVAYLLRRRAGL
jgi:hypothetical protein